MDELTRQALEEELQRDLQELESKATTNPTAAKKKSTKKKTATTNPTAAKKKSTKKKTVNKVTRKTANVSTPAPTTPTAEELVKETTPVAEENKTDIPPPSATPDEIKSRRIFIGSIVVLIIIFLALFFGAKYLQAPNDNTLEYNGFEFTKEGAHWVFLWQTKNHVFTIPLRYSPPEVLDVPIHGTLDEAFNEEKNIYLAFDPTDKDLNVTAASLGAAELSASLTNALGKTVVPSCVQDDGSTACQSQEIVSCEDPQGKAIIYLKTEAPTGIYIQGTCIVMQGEGLELLKSIDKVLYTWYQVI